MNTKTPESQMGDANEVSELIDTLVRTGQRLEELTAGQVDTVADHEGRTLLLRGTHEQLHRSETDKQAAILNALPAHIALLDGKGNIISVNDSWRGFASADLMQGGAGCGVGLNYLDVCDSATGEDSSGAHVSAAGIRSVLRGDEKSFSLEYASPSALEQRWFLLTVTPLATDRLGGVVVMHSDITASKQAVEVLRQSDEKLRMLVQGVKDYAILMLDPAGRITTWNEGAERIKGYRADEIIGEHFSKFYTPQALAQRLPEEELKIAAEQGRFEEQGWRVRKDGSQFWANVVISALRDATGRLRGFAKVTRDDTARKQAEANLQSLAERLSLATTIAKVGVWEWNLASNTLTWDDTMFAIYGFPQMVPMPYEDWSRVVHPRDLPHVEAILNAAIDEKGEGFAEFRIILPTGEVRNVSAAERVVLDDSGNAERVIGVNVDVTERKQAEEASRISEVQLTRLAEHDFLTGLPNRRLLNDRIAQAIESARLNGKNLALLFLDIDGFKHINDSLGHSTGDKLIQVIATRLTECVPASDTVSRQGGDEYLVLLTDVKHPDETTLLARRLMETVAKSHMVDQHELHVSTCIGVSVYPFDGLDAETLIKNADTAMYQAKANGRPSYQFFQPAMNVRAVERQSLEEDLRRALGRQEFALHYQPKINLKTGAITGAEALLRWKQATRGVVSPAQFIPVAEDSGLILPIGNWVLREACRQARAWLDAGLPAMTMAINVSGLQFQSEGFLEGLFATLDETGLDPNSLEVELTESILMKNVAVTATVIRALREKGTHVAIDDFGTGYSSLSYLNKFPIDVLKIDQSFISQITAAPDQTSIVNAIISMGQSLKLRIIAEGVETAEQLAFLKAQQCDEAQGYYFSRPVPPQEFAKLFKMTDDREQPVAARI